MLGLVPVMGPSVWLENMVHAYLIAREYLEPAEGLRGRLFSREDWIAVLLRLHSREEYLFQFAALNHAAQHKELAARYQERFLANIPDGDATAVRAALDGGVDGAPRAFLVRQIVLRAVRLVLVPPELLREPDPAVAATLAGIGAETAAVLLVHLAADALRRKQSVTEPRLGPTTESLAMEIVANSLFNEHDDIGDMLARYRLLWVEYGSKLSRDPARATPAELLREATGLELDDILALGFGFYAQIVAHEPEAPIATHAFTNIAVDHDTIELFLGLFSTTAVDLSAALAACPKPWQMLPIQERPLLRRGDDVVVLDEQYLIERITRGLYWLVHDHEKLIHGEQARNQWTKAYGEMIESRAEDQLRRMAPPLFGGHSSFFTEEDLLAAFPGQKNCDAGIDFGSETVLAEVVSGTVTVPTREQADAAAFRSDTDKLVITKAGQLDVAARNLLTDPQPLNSPLSSAARHIAPIIIVGGQYPVNPVTVHIVDDLVAAENLFADPRISRLGLMDFEELEACEALHEHRNVSLNDILAAWQRSPYQNASFRNYLWSEYGDQNIGRPDDIRRALEETRTVIMTRLRPEDSDTPTSPQTSQAQK